MMMKLSLHYTDEQNIEKLKKTNALVVNQLSLSGFLNMEIDKFIFENFEKIAEEDLILIRFYTFTNHTVTLGYFQNNIDQEIKNMYKKWAFVKRITGGKAVFHYPKKDLTLCVVGIANTIKSKTKNQNIPIIKNIHETFNELLWNSIIKTTNLQNTIDKVNDIVITEKIENQIQNKLRRFDCFKNIQDFEKEFNGRKVIGTAIKISQFSNNPFSHKFILQANIKLQNVHPELNISLKNKVIQNFLNHFDKIYPIQIKDLLNLFKKKSLVTVSS